MLCHTAHTDSDLFEPELLVDSKFKFKPVDTVTSGSGSEVLVAQAALQVTLMVSDSGGRITYLTYYLRLT